MDPDLVSTPSLDSMFAALADSRRRYVMAVMGQRGGPTVVDELARAIARTEHDVVAGELPAATVRSVALALYHVHVPTLSAAGLLAYDDAARTVAPTDRGRRFEPVVSTALGVDPK